jgi:hypothetical protein
LNGNVAASFVEAPLEQAAAVCERKGNVVMARRMRERLDDLTAARG